MTPASPELRKTASLPPDLPAEPAAPVLAARSLLGGTLMGLANLVPGISGGTMLLAAGVYPRFVAAIAELTRLRFRPRSLLVLGVVGAAAGLAILLLAGPVKTLVVEHRWAMYSLFIGLTLGGVPVVWGMVGHPTRSLWAGAAAGFGAMAALAVAQASGAGAGSLALAGPAAFGIGGILGASAMILPGVSGGYLLLVLGLYVPILGAIDAFKDALAAGDLAAALPPAAGVLLPVGIGVGVGIVAVSNLIRWLLARHEKPTLGVLLGLLVGAVAGLWPFQRGVNPIAGDVWKGRLLTVDEAAAIPPEDWPTVWFTPTAGQVAGSIALILAGFALTALVARLGREKRPSA